MPFLMGNRRAILGGSTPLPKIDWDFTELRLPTDVTFTRCSSGTYFDGAGVLQTEGSNDVARFDHTPATGEPLGLLVEPARTNLHPRSEEIDNESVWARTNVTVDDNATGTTAPDGNTTAERIIEAGTTGSHYIQENVTVDNATIYTESGFIKAAERTWAFIEIYSTDDGSGQQAISINLDTGAFTELEPSGGAILVAGTQDVGNGWYRWHITYTTSSTNSRIILSPADSAETGRPEHAGNVLYGIYVWGMQIEKGYLSSYIATTSGAVTRSADVATVTANLPVNAPSFTVFVESQTPVGSNSERVFQASNSGNNPRCIMAVGAGPIADFRLYDSSSAVISHDSLSIAAAGEMSKRIFAIGQSNDAAWCVDGGSIVTDIAYGNDYIGGFNQMSVGNANSSSQLRACVKRLTIWPRRLKNADLIRLTR